MHVYKQVIIQIHFLFLTLCPQPRLYCNNKDIYYTHILPNHNLLYYVLPIAARICMGPLLIAVHI